MVDLSARAKVGPMGKIHVQWTRKQEGDRVSDTAVCLSSARPALALVLTDAYAKLQLSAIRLRTLPRA